MDLIVVKITIMAEEQRRVRPFSRLDRNHVTVQYYSDRKQDRKDTILHLS